MLNFQLPRYLFANAEAVKCPSKRKSGDIVVVFPVKGEEFEAVQTDCQVPNRKKQHDVIVAGWCYRARPSQPDHPLPAWKRSKIPTPPPEPIAQRQPLPEPEVDMQQENEEQEEREREEDAEEEAGSDSQRKGGEEEAGEKGKKRETEGGGGGLHR